MTKRKVTASGSGPAAAVRGPIRVGDKLVDDLRRELADIMHLSKDDFFAEINILAAGDDFQNYMNCGKNLDCHLYSSDLSNADRIANEYAKLLKQFNRSELLESNADPSAEETFQISGVVEYFDCDIGYGFIASDDGPPYIIFHCSHLHAFGVNGAEVGMLISGEAVAEPPGARMKSIHSIGHPTSLNARSNTNASAPAAANGIWDRAFVIWFNHNRQVAFLSLGPGRPQICVYADVIERSGIVTLETGQIIEVKWGQQDNRPVASELRPAAETVRNPGASAPSGRNLDRT